MTTDLRARAVDRSIHLALEECLGHVRPPDRCAEILARLHGDTAGQAAPRPAPSRPRQALRTAALVLAAVGITVLVGLDQSRRTPAPAGGPGPLHTVRSRADIDALPADATNVRGIGLVDADLRGFARLARLQRLDLTTTWRRRIEVSDAGLTHLAGLRQLRELRLDFQRGIRRDLTALTGLDELRVLSLHSTSIEDRALATLPKLAGLRELDLSECRHVTDQGIRHLVACRRLAVLRLQSLAWLAPAALASLGSLAELRELDLSGVDGRRKWYDGKPRPGGSTTGVTNEVLAGLARLTKVRRLRLCHAEGFRDEGLAHLAGWSALRSLDLTGCAPITDAGIRHLPTGIEELILFGTAVEGDALRRFPRLRHLDLNTCRHLRSTAVTALLESGSRGSLRHLDLSGCKLLTAADLARIAAGLPGLQVLELAYCPWLEDADLARLAPLRGVLTTLDLSQNGQLGAECLVHLQGFERLGELGIEDVELDGPALQRLAARLPGLRIRRGPKDQEGVLEEGRPNRRR